MRTRKDLRRWRWWLACVIHKKTNIHRKNIRDYFLLVFLFRVAGGGARWAHCTVRFCKGFCVNIHDQYNIHTHTHAHDTYICKHYTLCKFLRNRTLTEAERDGRADSVCMTCKLHTEWINVLFAFKMSSVPQQQGRNGRASCHVLLHLHIAIWSAERNEFGFLVDGGTTKYIIHKF